MKVSEGCASPAGARKESGPGLSTASWWFLGLYHHNSYFHMAVSHALVCLHIQFLPFHQDASYDGLESAQINSFQLDYLGEKLSPNKVPF